MEFNLLNEKIHIGSERIEYNYYRLMFQQEAEEAVRHFESLYKQNHSLEMVVKNVQEQMEDSVYPAIRRCISILVDKGILTIDEDLFIDMYPQFADSIQESYLQIYDQYADIVMTEEEKDRYRVARREGRGKWRGGGFGLSGALKGAATAGALNMVSGTGHMVFNGVAKIGSSIAASSKMNRIFKDKNTMLSLCNGLWQSVFSLHRALIDCLARNGADNGAAEGTITAEEIRAASAILENISQIQEYGQRRKAMLQSFQMNPYQKKWYRIALQEFGDEDGTLEEIERYFGLSVVREEKEKYLNQFARSLSLDTEPKALIALQKIQEEKERIHYEGETEQTRLISEAVTRFDVEYRTVDGAVLPTRDEADMARSELAEIKEIEREVDFTSLESIEEGERRISGFSSLTARSYQKSFHEKWVNLDTELRTVSTLLPDKKTILCKTYQQAESLRPAVQSLKNRLDACGEGAASEDALIALKETLHSEHVPILIIDSYKEEIDMRLQRIDVALRTTLQKEYPTREAARAAERQYKQVKEDFVTGNPRKNGEQFRKRIESSDFSDVVKKELSEELFQLENEKELKTIKTFSFISSMIILIIVIASYFFQLSGTASFMDKDITIFDISLKVMDIEIVDGFTFLDGMKNGLVVFGRCLGDMFVNGFWDFINGFSYGWIGNILWFFLGLFWIIIKQMCIFIPRYLVSLFSTFFQPASINYYIGYIIGSAIPIGVCQFSFDEDKQKENVERVKGWNIKKVGITILVLLIITVISFYFIWIEQ